MEYEIAILVLGLLTGRKLESIGIIEY